MPHRPSRAEETTVPLYVSYQGYGSSEGASPHQCIHPSAPDLQVSRCDVCTRSKRLLSFCFWTPAAPSLRAARLPDNSCFPQSFRNFMSTSPHPEHSPQNFVWEFARSSHLALLTPSSCLQAFGAFAPRLCALPRDDGLTTVAAEDPTSPHAYTSSRARRWRNCLHASHTSQRLEAKILVLLHSAC